MAESGLNSGLNISRGIGDGQAQVWDFTNAIKTAENVYLTEERKRLAAQKLYEDTMASVDPRRQKLRPADVPAYLNEYNEFKKAKALLASGKVKNPMEIAELNAIADKAAGKMQQRVAKSIEQQEFEKSAAQALWTNPDNFEDYTPTVLAAMKNNPVENIEANQLAGIDYTNSPLAGAKNLRDISLYSAKQFDPNLVKHWNETAKVKEPEYDAKKGMVRENEVEVLKLTPEAIIQDSHKWFNSNKAAARTFSKILEAERASGMYDAVIEKFYQKYPQFEGKPVVDPATYFAARHLAAYEPKVSVGKWDYTPEQKEANARERQRLGANLSLGNAISMFNLKNPPDLFDYKAYEEAANAVTGNVTARDGKTYNAHDYLVQQTNNIVRNLPPDTEGIVITRRNLLTGKTADPIIRKLFPENAGKIISEFNKAKASGGNTAAVQVVVDNLNKKYANDIGKALTINDVNAIGIPVVITKEAKTTSDGKTVVSTVPNFIYGTNLKGRVAQLLNKGKKGTQDVLDNYEFEQPIIPGW